jgi:hypothetical protein
VVKILSKEGFGDKISFICIDKRVRDPKTNQPFILLENGTKVMMPPNLHSVPALLLVKQNYRFLLGDDIIKHYHSDILTKKNNATNYNGEPAGFSLASFSGTAATNNVVSEQYTMYNMTADELSAKGHSQNRPLYNYVSAADEILSINTPPDNYRPDKVNVTIDTLQQQRMDEISQIRPQQQAFASHI